MKVEQLNEDCIDVFLNKYNFSTIDIENKESLLKLIKDIIIKLDTRYKLDLCGFFKIKVYPNSKVGVFLNIIKIDDNEFSNEADFRIIIYPNEKFFFETEDYEILPKKINKRFYNGKFYIDIDEIDNLENIIDMGRIIYDGEVKDMLKSSQKIK